MPVFLSNTKTEIQIMQNLSAEKSVFGLDQNLVALLCYLPFFFVNLIFSIAVITQDKQNKIVRFHAFQSLFLILASVILQFVFMIVLMIVWVGGGIAAYAIDANSGMPIASMIMMVVWLLLVLLVAAIALGSFLFAIIAMIKAYNLQKWKIPIVGKYAEKYAG